MITKLQNARIYDPINRINGKIRDLYIKMNILLRSLNVMKKYPKQLI